MEYLLECMAWMTRYRIQLEKQSRILHNVHHLEVHREKGLFLLTIKLILKARIFNMIINLFKLLTVEHKAKLIMRQNNLCSKWKIRSTPIKIIIRINKILKIQSSLEHTKNHLKGLMTLILEHQISIVKIRLHRTPLIRAAAHLYQTSIPAK